MYKSTFNKIDYFNFIKIPGLIPPELFSLWVVMNDLVYRLKSKTILELQESVSDTFFFIEMCQMVCRTVTDRVEHEGQHFEH